MPEPTFLDHLFANVLVRIELASGVKAVRYSAGEMGTTISIGRNGEGNEPPPSDAPHLSFQRRYAGCADDVQRRAVIRDALEELRSIRYSRKPMVDRDTVEGRLMIGRDPRPVMTVAYVYGLSRTTIYRLRAHAREIDGRMAA